MKVGDYVQCFNVVPSDFDKPLGVVVGFNDPGEGGKHFVHVLTADGIELFAAWNLHVVDYRKLQQKDEQT